MLFTEEIGYEIIEKCAGLAKEYISMIIYFVTPTCSESL